MTKNQRKILSELLTLSNTLGHTLDYTAVSRELLIDRQQALMLVYRALYGMFGDDKENPQREFDMKYCEDAINELRKLRVKVYPDSSGNLFYEDEKVLRVEQGKGIYKIEEFKL